MPSLTTQTIGAASSSVTPQPLSANREPVRPVSNQENQRASQVAAQRLGEQLKTGENTPRIQTPKRVERAAQNDRGKDIGEPLDDRNAAEQIDDPNRPPPRVKVVA